MTPNLKELVDRLQKLNLVCLVPKEGKSGITSHEKTVCDCDVLTLLEVIRLQDQLNLDLVESHEGVYLDEFWDSPMGKKTKTCFSEIEKLLERVK